MFRVSLCVLCLMAGQALAQPKMTREQRVREDKKNVEADGYWIYNDLAKGLAEAKKSGKPIIAILRCVPCLECVKLDDDLVNKDKELRPLLDQFVRVRVVSTNGLDLSLFQFDTDQSFAAFLLNADGAIYGRFGTRSHRTNWVGDVSIPGLAKALQGALDLHAEYPNNKSTLAGRKGPAPEFPTPEKFPTLKAKYTATLNYTGNVVQSCIHCHQIGDAQREFYRAKKMPIPETLLFPHPHPKVVGLVMDPKEKAKVVSVDAGSAAARAGLKSGDAIASLGGQPLLSIADLQWVLHTTPPEGGKVAALVDRAGKKQELSLELADGWRRAGDLSWRSSTWGLRRMATGGLVLESMTDGERTKAGVPDNGMGLRVKHVGQFGPHAAAQQAGFRVSDVVIEWDGKTDLVRETDVLRHGVTVRKAGDRVPVTVLRNGKRTNLTLPMQP